MDAAGETRLNITSEPFPKMAIWTRSSDNGRVALGPTWYSSLRTGLEA